MTLSRKPASGEREEIAVIILSLSLLRLLSKNRGMQIFLLVLREETEKGEVGPDGNTIIVGK